MYLCLHNRHGEYLSFYEPISISMSEDQKRAFILFLTEYITTIESFQFMEWHKTFQF